MTQAMRQSLPGEPAPDAGVLSGEAAPEIHLGERARTGWPETLIQQALTIADGLGLDLANIEIHADAFADQRLAGRARGMQQGRALFLDSQVFDPESYEGRYLLAHELTHAAQRLLPSGWSDGDVELRAEVEAVSIGHSFARGEAFDRPVISLGAKADPAFDDEEQRENKQLANPPKFKRARVTIFGILYVAANATVRWLPGMDKTLLGLAAAIYDLVGPSAYSAGLVRGATAAVGGLDSIQEQSSLVGKATQNDKANEFRLDGRLALALAHWLMGPPNKLKLTLTAKNLATLQAGVDVGDTYPDIRNFLPAYYSQSIYGVVTAQAHNTALQNYAAALRSYEQSGNDGDEAKLSEARQVVVDALDPAIAAVDAVRNDRTLVDHPAYRAIWQLPVKTKDEPPGRFKLDEESAVDPALMVTWLLDLENDPDRTLAGQAVQGSGPARKQLLDNFSKRAGLRQLDLGGDQLVGDRAAKATMPPLPSKLTTYPELESPFYDLPKGSDRTFTMSVWFPDVFEAWPGNYRYHFEILRIPDSSLAKLQETADDLEARGESPGTGALLGSRLSRDVGYGATDIQRSIGSLSIMLGPPGFGATTIVAVGAMLRLVGTVIRTIIEKITTPVYEKSLPFSSEGLFIVRAISWPSAASDKDVLITRAQSVAWLPVWVRPAKEMSQLRANLDRKLRAGAFKRLQEIRTELSELEAEGSSAKDYVQRKQVLLDEMTRIEGGLFGGGDVVLDQEKTMLQEALKSAEAGSHRERSIKNRLEEIDKIKTMRAERLLGVKDAALGFEPPFRLIASFVGDTGQTVRPLLEAYEVGKSGKRRSYRVVDSTTKNSGYRDGSGETRVDAIADAVRRIFESGQGYGRGYATIWIPDTMYESSATLAQGGVEKVIRIDADEGQVLMEAVENLALVVSIAAVAAAPFTGGASLAILIPVGVIGAIPSAYRLIDRAQQGTLRMDMAAAMDVVNIVGAAVGVARASAAGKAALRGVQVGNGWMALGLGTDGLSFAVMGAAFIEQIKEILDSDPNMPEGVKRARIMEAVGNQLLQAGILVGSHLAAEGKSLREANGAANGIELNHPRIQPELEAKFREAAGPAAKDIPVFRDADGTRVKGNGVEISWELDGYGLPRDLKIIAGPTAGAGELVLHAKYAKAAMKYQGFCGYLRYLLDRVAALITGKKQQPKANTRAAEAALELKKLPEEIERIHKLMQEGKVVPEDAEAYLQHLQKQVREHEQALTEMEQGQQFIMAQAPTGEDAVKHGYPPAPRDHFYVQSADGKSYELRRHVGSDAPRYKVEFKDKVPTLVPDTATPPKGAELPTHDAGTPAAPSLKPPAPEVGLDMARLRADLTRALKVAPTALVIDANATFDHVSVRPISGGEGGYEVHFKPGTPEAKILEAVERHIKLAAERPADVSANPYTLGPRGGKVPWSGAKEAAYLGHPEAEKGYYWSLKDGELRYSRDDASNPETSKRVYDEKLGQFKDDPGGSKAEEPFLAGTTKESAFELLGGNDPKSAFGSWVEVVGKELKLTKEELIARMKNPGELTPRTVRHSLKEPITKELVKKINSIADKAARHRKMLEVTDKLASADRGSIAEQWYFETYAPEAPGTEAARHVELDKEALAAAQPPYDKIDISQDRVPDIVDGSTVKEVKDVRGPLGERDKLQDIDVEKIVGKTIPVDGKPVKITKKTTIFPEPAGGAANADWIAQKLSQSRVNSTYEVFNGQGERKIITRADLAQGTFNKVGGPDGLAQAIREFCK